MVAATRVTQRFSTPGSSASCWALVNRWISSMNSTVSVPCCGGRRRASSMTARTSLTPAVTAESSTNAAAGRRRRRRTPASSCRCPAGPRAPRRWARPDGRPRRPAPPDGAAASRRRAGAPDRRPRPGSRGRMRTASGAPAPTAGRPVAVDVTASNRSMRAGYARVPTSESHRVRDGRSTCDDDPRVRPSRSRRRPPSTPHRRRVAGARRPRVRAGRARGPRREPLRPAEHGRAGGPRLRERRGPADPRGRGRRRAVADAGPPGRRPGRPRRGHGARPGPRGARGDRRRRLRDRPPRAAGRLANPAAAPLVAQDGDGFLVVVELEPDLSAEDQQAALDDVEQRLQEMPDRPRGRRPGRHRDRRRDHAHRRRDHGTGRDRPAHR